MPGNIYPTSYNINLVAFHYHLSCSLCSIPSGQWFSFLSSLEFTNELQMSYLQGLQSILHQPPTSDETHSYVHATIFRKSLTFSFRIRLDVLLMMLTSMCAAVPETHTTRCSAAVSSRVFDRSILAVALKPAVVYPSSKAEIIAGPTAS